MGGGETAVFCRRRCLRGSIQVEHTLARLGLWRLLGQEPYVNALGAMTGNQAVQMVQAGLKAIYLSGMMIAVFQQELGKMGYAFQFITLAGFHNLNASMFALADDYRARGMSAYADFQEHEFKLHHEYGFQAMKRQSFVGAGYFDEIQTVVAQGETSTAALKGSTEEEQFEEAQIEEAPYLHAHVPFD